MHVYLSAFCMAKNLIVSEVSFFVLRQLVSHCYIIVLFLTQEFLDRHVAVSSTVHTMNCLALALVQFVIYHVPLHANVTCFHCFSIHHYE